MTTPANVVRDLRSVLDPNAVMSDEASIVRVLKDNSWLSPLLMAELDERLTTEGPTLGVSAVVAPTTESELCAAVGVAASHRVPITPRGSGTSNFGLVTPSEGGIIVDLRGLKSDCTVDGHGIHTGAGTLQGEMEAAARAGGRELTLLTTTYASATVGGWIAGGHVGLGSSMHGSVWDHNVVSTRVVTVEEQPVVVDLNETASIPLLHTFGTVGIVSALTLRTVPAVSYLEAVANFATFDMACAFVHEISSDTSYRHRVVTAQEPELVPAFRMLKSELGDGAGVLMIIDDTQADDVADLAGRHGGEFRRWQPWQVAASGKASIAAMVYGHRMLWVKKLYPDAAFLHVYFDPSDPQTGVQVLKDRFGSDVLIEMKYIRSRWLRSLMGYPGDGILPASVITIRHGNEPGRVSNVMDYCDEVGIRYQNPHTSVIEDSGMFPDVNAIAALKRRLDPHRLLNPGKLRAGAI